MSDGLLTANLPRSSQAPRYENKWSGKWLKCMETGKPGSTFCRNWISREQKNITGLPDVGAAPAAVIPEKSDLDLRCIFLMDSRHALFKRIDERCEIMLAKNGLISEVTELLLENRLRLESSPARAIGYRQVIEYLLARKLDLEGVEDPKQAFRSFLKVSILRFVRRQLP
mmetsp:Transcript_9680/g.14111  ORF Transcript_9680/g.14111 Transcript_9680/m.14111 type:complete len:170 (-) Transcript_9680:157-666(-)